MKDFFVNLKIGTKVTIAVGALLFFSLSILGILTYEKSSQTLEDTIGMFSVSRAEDNAKLVSRSIKNQIQNIEEVALRNDVKSMDWDSQKPIIASETKRLGYLWMGVASLNGSLKTTDGKKTDISTKEYFIKAKNGSLNIVDPLVSKTDGGKIVIQIACPIRSDRNEIVGVLLATLDYKILSQIIGDVKVGKSGYAYMLNKECTTIAHPKAELVINKDNDFENIKTDPKLKELVELERGMVQGKTGFGSYSYDGIRKFLAYAPVPDTGWSIALAIPRAEMFEEISSIRNWIIFLLFLFTLFSLTLSMIIIKYMIINPIYKLIEVSDKLSRGDISASIQTNTKDEMGKLMGSFNQMIESIRLQSQAAKSIADGDLNVAIVPRSENDILSKSLQNVLETLKELIAEAGILTKEAAEGNLKARGDGGKFRGGYRDIIIGINETLDTVTEPIIEAREVLGKISLNDYSLEMKGAYRGLLQEFSADINLVRTRLLSIQDTFIQLTNGDTSKLEEFHSIGKRSANDNMTPSITTMMEVIHDLIDEVEFMANAAINGDLSVKGNVGGFKGGYAKIIDGFNKTLTAMVTPIEESLSALKEMSKGNLQVTMNNDYKGEYLEIRNAITSSIESFNNVLGGINSAAEQVAMGAQHVTDSSQSLAQGATEQASCIEEVTASIEQIAAQTKQNAISASQANELALNAKEGALNGNQQMKEMLKAMEEINSSSADISKIIKVIDEIAFQTNILSLNAAVEAARAGQYGKGFAVVAEEVRNLAARSASAAKETAALIESSIKKVGAGTEMARNTAEALDRMVQGITHVASIAGEIAVASNEQATGITQVNQAVSQVSQVTQMSTATAEENAASSEELSSQAEVLRSLIGRFKLAKAANSTGKLDNLSPEIMKAIEELLEKQNLHKSDNTKIADGNEKKAAQNPRARITLDERDFGKY